MTAWLPGAAPEHGRVASAAGVSLSTSSCPTPQVFITPRSGPVDTAVVGKSSTVKPKTTLQFGVGFGTGRTHDEISTSGVTLANGQTGRAGTFRTSVKVPGYVHGRNGLKVTPAGPAQFGALARDAATGGVYQADAAFTVLPAGAGGTATTSFAELFPDGAWAAWVPLLLHLYPDGVGTRPG